MVCHKRALLINVEEWLTKNTLVSKLWDKNLSIKIFARLYQSWSLKKKKSAEKQQKHTIYKHQVLLQKNVMFLQSKTYIKKKKCKHATSIGWFSPPLSCRSVKKDHTLRDWKKEN